MYAQLGDIIFEGLYGVENFTRKDSISVPQHKRINLRPKVQFTGVNLGVVKITIHLHRSFIDVEAAIKKFRDYRNSVEKLRYVTGSGNVIGTFIITDTKEKHKQTTKDGDIVSAKLEHTLLETTWSSIEINTNNAIANSRNNPVINRMPVRTTPPTLPVEAAQNVATARTAAYSSDHLIGEGTVNINKAAHLVSEARERVVTSREHAAEAAAQVQQAQETYEQAQDYVANMYTAINRADQLVNAIDAFNPADPVGSMNDINDVNSDFMNGVAVMTNTSQPLATYTGSRR